MDQNAFDALVAKLLSIEPFNQLGARDVLLKGVPGSAAIRRSDMPLEDVQNIIRHACDAEALHDTGRSVLDIVRDNAVLFAGAKTELAIAIAERFQILKESQEIETEVTHDVGDEIEFANRHKELRYLVGGLSPQHHLLDGSTGYGKSELLKALKKQFVDTENNICACASAPKNGDLSDLVRDLCRDLKLDATSVAGDSRNATLLGRAFASVLLNVKFPNLLKSKPKRRTSQSMDSHSGVVLLFDDIGQDKPELARALLGEFIPEVIRQLDRYPFFKSYENRPRVFVSGCHLRSLYESQKLAGLLNRTLGWSCTRLSEFDYDAIFETVQHELPTLESDELMLLSAHILHRTGGHPGCMADALRLFRKKIRDPDDFDEDYAQTVMQLVNQKADEVFYGLPSHLRDICQRLSVFRCFTGKMIAELQKTGDIKYDKDHIGLRNDLLDTWLYLEGKNGVLFDSIVRRLLVLRLRFTSGSSQFAGMCRQAYEMYFSLLNSSRKRPPEPERWAVECLYQVLQQNVDSIDTREKRAELRARFFGEFVEQVLDAYNSNSDDSDAGEDAQRAGTLALEMEDSDRNWDFRFAVNYYLRDDCYVEEPYSRLIGCVRAWRRR